MVGDGDDWLKVINKRRIKGSYWLKEKSAIKLTGWEISGTQFISLGKVETNNEKYS